MMSDVHNVKRSEFDMAPSIAGNYYFIDVRSFLLLLLF
jgi:hypothetical protein